MSLKEKIIAAVIGMLLLGGAVSSFLTQRKLTEAIQKIDYAQHYLDTALSAINHADSTVIGLRDSLAGFNSFLDISRRKSEEINRDLQTKSGALSRAAGNVNDIIKNLKKENSKYVAPSEKDTIYVSY